MRERLDMRRGSRPTSPFRAPFVHEGLEPRLFGGGGAGVRDRSARLIALQRSGDVVDARENDSKLGGDGFAVDERVHRGGRGGRRRRRAARIHGREAGGELGLKPLRGGGAEGAQ